MKRHYPRLGGGSDPFGEVMVVVWMRMLHRGLCPVVLLCMAFLLAGTSSYAAAREEEKEGGITQEELQSTLMGVADRLASTIAEASYVFERRVGSDQARLLASRTRLYPIVSAFHIASGPNPGVSLLDMVVLVTLERVAWELHWKAVFGDPADLMIQAWRKREADVWSIAASVLTPVQQSQLADLIKEWRVRNPDKRYVAFLRFRDFAESLQKSALVEAAGSGGLFGIGEVTRAVDEARFLAERGMYLFTRLMMIVPFEIEVVYQKMITEPAVGEFLSTSTELVRTMNRMTKLAEELPEIIAEQRKAGLDEVVKAFQKARSATIDETMKQVTTEREAAIDHLMDRVAAERKAIFNRSDTEGDEWVDHAFYRGVLLILIFFAAMLAYRFTSEKLLRLGQGKRSS